MAFVIYIFRRKYPQGVSAVARLGRRKGTETNDLDHGSLGHCAVSFSSGLLRLQPAHGDHVVGRERAAGDEGGRLRQVRNQLIQDVHGIQGRLHAQVTTFSGVMILP